MVITTVNKKLTAFNVGQGVNLKSFIVIHDVGVKGQTAKNNIDYFANGYRGASAHYFVDRTSIWQSVDDNKIAWHVGDGKGKYGITNSNSIGIEMIVEKDGTIHDETKANTKRLVNMLQAKYNVPNNKIVRHFDASRKNCPQFLNRDGKWTEWHEFYKYLTTEEGLTMDQYTELKNLINAQAKRIEELENIVDEKDAQVSLWAKDGWAWAVKEGLVDGTMPKRPLTREQFAAIEYRKAKK